MFDGMLVNLIQLLVAHRIDVHVLVKEHVVMVPTHVTLAVNRGVITESLCSSVRGFVAVSFRSGCKFAFSSVVWRVLAHEVVVGCLYVRQVHFLASVRAIGNTSVKNVWIEVAVFTNELWWIFAHFLLVIMSLTDLTSHSLSIKCILTFEHIIK